MSSTTQQSVFVEQRGNADTIPTFNSIFQYVRFDELYNTAFEKLYADINDRVAPFDNIPATAKGMHVVPVKRGFRVFIPSPEDAAFVLPKAEREAERLSREVIDANGNKTLRPRERKPFGVFLDQWEYTWTQIFKYLENMQQTALDIHNLISSLNAAKTFTERQQLEFDRLSTRTLTFQHQFVVAAIILLNQVPPQGLYFFAINQYPAIVYRTCTPYHLSCIETYSRATPAQLATFAYVHNDQTGKEDKIDYVTGLRQHNFVATRKLQTGASQTIPLPLSRVPTMDAKPTITAPTKLVIPID